MCHHSLPSIISPIRDKSVVVKIFLVDYICILIAYVGLGMASLLAFGGLPDNPSACPPSRIMEAASERHIPSSPASQKERSRFHSHGSGSDDID